MKKMKKINEKKPFQICQIVQIVKCIYNVTDGNLTRTIVSGDGSSAAMFTFSHPVHCAGTTAAVHVRIHIDL